MNRKFIRFVVQGIVAVIALNGVSVVAIAENVVVPGPANPTSISPLRLGTVNTVFGQLPVTSLPLGSIGLPTAFAGALLPVNPTAPGAGLVLPLPMGRPTIFAGTLFPIKSASSPTAPVVGPTLPLPMDPAKVLPVINPGPNPNPNPSPVIFYPTPAELTGAVSCEAFGFDFYRQLVESGYAADKDANIALSPLSLASVLETLRLGTIGTAQQELTAALHAEPLASGSGLSLINPDVFNGQGVTLSSANSLWFDNANSPKPTYVAAVQGEFGDVIYNVDFRNPTTAAATINNWISVNTAGHINDILTPRDLPYSTKLVVANAVYFKGKWASAFNQSATQSSQFHLASGLDLIVSMMHNSGNYRFALVDGIEVLELPYFGNSVSMLLLLPATSGSDGQPISLSGFGPFVLAGSPSISGSQSAAAAPGSSLQGIVQLEALLQGDWLRNAVAKLQTQSVRVTIPKFTFACQPDAISTLKGLGITQIFTPSGYFAPIFDGDQFYVNTFKHKAWLQVNEEGTEAVAVTVAALSSSCVGLPMNYVDFIADHPFLFVIRDNATGTPLFIGRVSNPQAK